MRIRQEETQTVTKSLRGICYFIVGFLNIFYL